MSTTTSDVLRKILKFSPFERVVASIGELYFIFVMSKEILLSTTSEAMTIEYDIRSHFGYVYAVEVGDDVKIGKTSNPRQRMCQLSRVFDYYADKRMGRVALSPPHVNYSENEKLLLSAFGHTRKVGTELVSAPFDFVAGAMERLQFVKQYDDKSEQESIESFKRMTEDAWGISERTAQIVIECNDGFNDITIKCGNVGLFWIVINKVSIKTSFTGVMDYIFRYAMDNEVWEINDCIEDSSGFEDLTTWWMLDAMIPYCSRLIVESVKLYVQQKASEYNTKYDAFLDAMRVKADSMGQEFMLPPTPTYKQVMSMDYDGLMPTPLTPCK